MVRRERTQPISRSAEEALKLLVMLCIEHISKVGEWSVGVKMNLSVLYSGPSYWIKIAIQVISEGSSMNRILIECELLNSSNSNTRLY